MNIMVLGIMHSKEQLIRVGNSVHFHTWHDGYFFFFWSSDF